MKRLRDFVVTSLVGGLLILAPIYIAILLLLKAMGSLVGLIRPIATLLPDWVPAEQLLSLVLVLVVCFLVGAAVRTRMGRSARERLEHSFFDRIPGYGVFKGLTQRLAGQGEENVWRPAFAEVEEALVPAFVIEELPDGRYTVFIPSVPTPFAGGVYVLTPERVHLLDATFAQAIKPISRWGAGCKDLVAGIRVSSATEPAAVLPRT
jgi:uncharacterized membrane protein